MTDFPTQNTEGGIAVDREVQIPVRYMKHAVFVLLAQVVECGQGFNE
jgi:hypothetical protein